MRDEKLKDLMPTVFVQSRGAHRSEVHREAKAMYEEWLKRAQAEDPNDEALDSVESLLETMEHHLVEITGSMAESRTAMQSLEKAEYEFNQWQLDQARECDFGSDRIAELNFLSMVVSRRDIDRGTLNRLQTSFYEKSHSSPFIAAAANCMTNWTIGKGFNIKCFQPDVADFITELKSYNKFDQMWRDVVRDGWIDGEMPIIHDISPKTGIDLWTPIPAIEISQIEVKADTRNPLAYYREAERDRSVSEWIASSNYYQQLQDDRRMERSDHHRDLNKYYLLQMLKYGSGTLVNGRPPLAASIKYFTMLEQLVKDRVNLVHHVSTVVWIVTLYRRTAEALRRRFQPPDGNAVLPEVKNLMEYRREEPKIQATDVAEDINLAGHVASGAGIGLPWSMLTNRADLEVYASLRSSHTEFSQNVEANQQLHAWTIDEAFRIGLRGAQLASSKPLPPTVKVAKYSSEANEKAWAVLYEMVHTEGVTSEEMMSELVAHVMKADKELVEIPTDRVKIEVIPSNVISDDPLAMAQALEIEMRNELVSKTTAAAKLGRDLSSELVLMGLEQKAMAGLTPRPPVATVQGRGSDKVPSDASPSNSPGGKTKVNPNPNNNTPARKGGSRK